MEQIIQSAAGRSLLRFHRPNLGDASGECLISSGFGQMELGSDRQVNRLPLRDTGEEKEDFQILKIVRLWIESSNHSVVQFLLLLLGIGFGFSEIENIAGLVILNRQGRFHVAVPPESYRATYAVTIHFRSEGAGIRDHHDNDKTTPLCIALNK